MIHLSCRADWISDDAPLCCDQLLFIYLFIYLFIIHIDACLVASLALNLLGFKPNHTMFQF